MVINILTKFGADWLIFVDVTVLTRKLWTDGHRQTLSDHNSSLSTPCSGELKRIRKTLGRKVKLLKMSNFTFFLNVFNAICILKSLNSHVSVVVCSVFEFGMISKWYIREWIKLFTMQSCIYPIPLYTILGPSQILRRCRQQLKYGY